MNNSSAVTLTSSSASTLAKTQVKESWMRMKTLYQADQQVKYLHLEADVECLLQEIQLRVQGKLSSPA